VDVLKKIRKKRKKINQVAWASKKQNDSEVEAAELAEGAWGLVFWTRGLKMYTRE
jgi:hypothetical protein